MIRVHIIIGDSFEAEILLHFQAQEGSEVFVVRVWSTVTTAALLLVYVSVWSVVC